MKNGRFALKSIFDVRIEQSIARQGIDYRQIIDARHVLPFTMAIFSFLFRKFSDFSRNSWLLLILGSYAHAWSATVFNVKDYGATGRKEQDARPAIQKSIDACAEAGGGTVLIPPGHYTSGALHLRSNLRLVLEAGATLFATPDPKAYDCGPIVSKAALLFGEDLENVSISGQGIIDGQTEYEWRPDDFEQNFDHKMLMEKLGKPIVRPVPKGFPKREVFPHLLWLGRSQGIKVTGLSLLRSPGWTISLFACQRISFEGLYIYSSLKEAVWADGIDLDGCQDATVANCVIETGDDCVALVSQNWWGKALPCQNITITNCRLSSASAGIKFSEGNISGVRNIQVVNTLFNNVNRGLAFNDMLGGAISNVLVSNVTINCNRFEWFWAGDGQPVRFKIGPLSEWTKEAPRSDEAPPGLVKNITFRNVIARAKGSSLFYGHAKSPLEGISLENVKWFLSSDSSAAYDTAEHALDFRHVRNVKLKNVEVFWEEPFLPAWKSAACFEHATDLELDNFVGKPAWAKGDAPAVLFKQVSNGVLRNCHGLDNGIFLTVMGSGTRNIELNRNAFSAAKVIIHDDVPPGAVKRH